MIWKPTLDKENYYNSSRRENLLPLNNYEYRNSYKDHYDNQGVRVNPAVLKNLSYSTSGGAGPSTGSPVEMTVGSNGKSSLASKVVAGNNVDNNGKCNILYYIVICYYALGKFRICVATDLG